MAPDIVESGKAISIMDLAYEVALSFHNSPKVVIVNSPVHGRPADRYVPSIKKAQENLGIYLSFFLTVLES